MNLGMRAVNDGNQQDTGTGTTARVLAVLGCFGERSEWTLGELAARLGLPKSTIHRLVGLCTEQGYIEPLGGGRYGIGTELSRVASRIAAQSPLLRVGTQAIGEIAGECHEVAILAAAVPDKLSMTYLAKAEPTADFRYHVELHTLLSLCWGACGRTILAHLPEPLVEEAIVRGRASPSGAPFDARALRADLAVIRDKGYCVSLGQHKLTAVGVAVPFFGAGGQVRGSIGVSIPTFRFKARMAKPIARAVAAHTEQITYVLGGA